jgi:hypothetical protein
MNSLKLQKKDNHNYIYIHPLDFIDTLENKKHIVLCYENHTFGKEIEYRFIKNGLIKGETCIYVTNKDNELLIESEMRSHNIDVDDYNKKGLLNIYKVTDFPKYSKDIIERAEEYLDEILSATTLPYRIVGKLIDEINTKELIQANMDLEQLFHSKFEKFNGSALCIYNINKNIFNTNGKWIETILENHHSAIFVTDNPEEGIAIDTG